MTHLKQEVEEAEVEVTAQSAYKICKTDCDMKTFIVSILIICFLLAAPLIAMIYMNEIYDMMTPWIKFFDDNPILGAFCIIGVQTIYIPLLLPIPVLSVATGFIYNRLM